MSEFFHRPMCLGPLEFFISFQSYPTFSHVKAYVLVAH